MTLKLYLQHSLHPGHHGFETFDTLVLLFDFDVSIVVVDLACPTARRLLFVRNGIVPKILVSRERDQRRKRR